MIVFKIKDYHPGQAARRIHAGETHELESVEALDPQTTLLGSGAKIRYFRFILCHHVSQQFGNLWDKLFRVVPVIMCLQPANRNISYAPAVVPMLSR